ncbi:hypothetical protein FLPS103534_06515 [Flavobacterium psychrophilum]
MWQFIVVKPVHFLKACFLMSVTELGMLTDVKPEQESKALSSIEITELGIVIDVKLEHL